MVKRWLEPLIQDSSLDPKMKLVAGPRQSGKTTLARSILKTNRLFAKKLGNLPVVQLLKEHGALQAKDRDVVSVSASRFLV